MPNNDLSLYHQILLLAIHNKKFPDYQYQHRCLARWFSSTFSTSYQDALNMHFEELLSHKLEFDLQDAKPGQIDKLFKKEFITKKNDIKNEETEKAEMENWSQSVADTAFKKRENELKQAENDLVKEEQIEEIPKNVDFPKDIKKTF